MSKIRDKAKKHFLDKIAGAKKKIVVEEWDAEMYVVPMNLKTMNIVEGYISKEDNVGAIVSMIINCCVEENGTPVFSDEDWDFLYNEVDPDVLIKISTMIGESNSTIGEVAENF